MSFFVILCGTTAGTLVWMRIAFICGIFESSAKIFWISLSESIRGSPPERITSQTSLCFFM